MLSSAPSRILLLRGVRRFYCSHDVQHEPTPQDMTRISSSRPRAELDPKVTGLLLKGKRVGRGSIPCTVPPEEVTQALTKCISSDDKLLQNVEKYIGTGQKIERYLHSRKLPMDSRNLIVTKNKFRSQITKKFSEEMDALTEENDREGLFRIEEQIEKELEVKLSTTRGNWKPIHFDHNATWSYILGGSSAFDYAASVHTLQRLFEADGGFSPSSHLDFGSGVGTFSWALTHRFDRSERLKEEFFIDLSSDMNDASRLFRADGQVSSPDKIIFDKGVFYRLHFPANEDLKYDLVTCGSSLSELESSELRLNIMDSLWRRVEEGGYLVVYERGTNAGFQVLSEVRDYLIQLQSFVEEDPSIEGELIAPCTHSLPCPRYLSDSIPCNFDVKYKNFQLDAFPNAYKEVVYKDRISYLIFRKGKSLQGPSSWHRIVKEKKKTKNTFICQLCTNKGTLEEIFAHKRDKILYKYTKQLEVGDLFRAELIKDK